MLNLSLTAFPKLPKVSPNSTTFLFKGVWGLAEPASCPETLQTSNEGKLASFLEVKKQRYGCSSHASSWLNVGLMLTNSHISLIIVKL